MNQSELRKIESLITQASLAAIWTDHFLLQYQRELQYIQIMTLPPPKGDEIYLVVSTDYIYIYFFFLRKKWLKAYCKQNLRWKLCVDKVGRE